MKQITLWESSTFLFNQNRSLNCIEFEFYLHVQKSPPLVPLLSWINQFHTPCLYFNIDFNIVLSITSRNSKWSLSFRFPHQHLVYVYVLPHTFHMRHSSHVFDLTTRVLFIEEHKRSFTSGDLLKLHTSSSS